MAMFLITCPVTGADELVGTRRIRSLVNHPTHIALTIDCPCGRSHVYRTGRRWTAHQRSVPAREARELLSA